MAEAPPNLDASPPQKKGGIMTLVKAIAFVSVIVLIEVAGASMLIPSAEETRAIAAKLQGADVEGEEDASEADSEAQTGEGEVMHENLINSFHLLHFDPSTGASHSIDFELYAGVLAEEEAEFIQLLSVNQKRIDEQVNVTMRGMEVVDLSDPTLGLIKRKILEKINRSLGKPLVREAIFSSYNFNQR